MLIELERGRLNQDLFTALQESDAAISVVTVSEVLQGVHRASAEHQPRRRVIVERIISGLQPVPIDVTVARVHSELWASLTAEGNLIGGHDLWIAATAIAHDLEVLTLDRRDFERVPGLRVAGA